MNKNYFKEYHPDLFEAGFKNEGYDNAGRYIVSKNGFYAIEHCGIWETPLGSVKRESSVINHYFKWVDKQKIKLKRQLNMLNG